MRRIKAIWKKKSNTLTYIDESVMTNKFWCCLVFVLFLALNENGEAVKKETIQHTHTLADRSTMLQTKQRRRRRLIDCCATSARKVTIVYCCRLRFDCSSLSIVCASNKMCIIINWGVTGAIIIIILSLHSQDNVKAACT